MLTIDNPEHFFFSSFLTQQIDEAEFYFHTQERMTQKKKNYADGMKNKYNCVYKISSRKPYKYLLLYKW